MLKKSRSKKTKTRKKRLACEFCQKRINEIKFQEVGLVSRFLTARGKIIGRVYSGNCSRHQKMLTKAIKRARVMKLL